MIETISSAVFLVFYSIAVFLIGIRTGKRSRKIDLAGLGAREAFAYFLLREKHRHRADIAQINNDLRKLDRAGIMAPDIPLNLWIEVNRGS